MQLNFRWIIDFCQTRAPAYIKWKKKIVGSTQFWHWKRHNWLCGNRFNLTYFISNCVVRSIINQYFTVERNAFFSFSKWRQNYYYLQTENLDCTISGPLTVHDRNWLLYSKLLLKLTYEVSSIVPVENIDNLWVGSPMNNARMINFKCP